MKKITGVLLILAAILSPAVLRAQSCVSYYPVQKGMITEMANYDAKGKLLGSSKTTVLNNESTATGYVVTIKSESFDDKGVNSGSGEYSYSCSSGNFVMSMKSYFDPKTMAAYKDMDVKIDAGDIDMPSNPTVGQTLKEGSLSMSASSGGFTVMNMQIRMFNRKVADIETITCPAGTFECIKITYDMETNAMFKIVTKGAQWFCKEVGAVKTETYDSNGKLLGSSLLTKLVK